MTWLFNRRAGVNHSYYKPENNHKRGGHSIWPHYLLKDTRSLSGKGSVPKFCEMFESRAKYCQINMSDGVPSNIVVSRKQQCFENRFRKWFAPDARLPPAPGSLVLREKSETYKKCCYLSSALNSDSSHTFFSTILYCANSRFSSTKHHNFDIFSIFLFLPLFVSNDLIK